MMMSCKASPLACCLPGPALSWLLVEFLPLLEDSLLSQANCRVRETVRVVASVRHLRHLISVVMRVLEGCRITWIARSLPLRELVDPA